MKKLLYYFPGTVWFFHALAAALLTPFLVPYFWYKKDLSPDFLTGLREEFWSRKSRERMRRHYAEIRTTTKKDL